MDTFRHCYITDPIYDTVYLILSSELVFMIFYISVNDLTIYLARSESGSLPWLFLSLHFITCSSASPATGRHVDVCSPFRQFIFYSEYDHNPLEIFKWEKGFDLNMPVLLIHRELTVEEAGRIQGGYFNIKVK